MADVTLAISEKTFATSVDVLKKNFLIEKSDSVDFGPFRAGYDLRAHLEGGSVDVRADGTVKLSELDLRWDRLRFSLGLDIEEVCVGGGCINLPFPFPDICLPEVCIFEDDPDVSINVNLAPFVAQEVSLEARLGVRYWDPEAPPPAIDLCDPLRDLLVNEAVMKPFPTDRNQWHIHLIPGPVDLDLFDFPDLVGDLIEDALTNAITALIPGGWVRDLVLDIIGGIAELIRTVLDIPDDIEEWLSDLFNVSFGLLDILTQAIGTYFGSCVPIYRIDDPLLVLAAETGELPLIPVTVPIANLAVTANDDELIVTADIGA